MEEKRKEAIYDYVSDMISIEQDILEKMEHQHKDKDVRKYPAVFDFIGRTKDITEQHISILERYRKGIDTESVMKKVLGTVADLATGLYDKMHSDAVSRMMRDDYTTLCLCAVSYHMLLTTALCWNETALAQICQRNLHDLTEIIPELGNLVCSVVGAELAEEGKIPNAGGAEEAFLRVKKLWGKRTEEVQT